MAKTAPSILSANFLELGRDIRNMEMNGADYVHIDVMDGLFVPNISVGLPVIRAIRPATSLPLDVHLMIQEPIRYVERFCSAGANILTVHVESDTSENIFRTLRMIRDCGANPSISLKPATPAEAVLPFLPLCSQILVMTVEPGFGGQTFMYDMMPKLKRISEYIADRNPDCDLEVDGGIKVDTAKICRENGANVLVSGSKFFRAPDPSAYLCALRGDE